MYIILTVVEHSVDRKKYTIVYPLLNANVKCNENENLKA